MHRRPPGFLITALRAALARSTELLSRRRGALLALAVAVAVLAGTALAGEQAGTAPSTVATAAAAASQALPAADGTAVAEQPANHRHRGDHQREAPQPAPAPAPAKNADCTLVVPSGPTGAAGLTTPYQLVATDRAAGPCHEADPDQSAFVEAAVFDPATHALSIYHPLVVDRNDQPAAPPVPVTLPAGAVVGIWFGFNGGTLTLAGPGAGDCVNGLPGSPFGQFAYCNAAGLFSAATADPTFQASIPQLGTSPKDGLPCPTSRDFSVVDQDQSDNLATVYRVIDGRMAQVTPTTAALGTKLTNGSDEGLVARFIAPALGCRPFTAPDLTDGGTPTPALALNELSAAAHQGNPAALVPTSDPMVQVDGAPSVRKTDLYRAGVGQPALPTGQTPREYCRHLLTLAPARLTTDAAFLAATAAPTPDSPNLLAFLQDRLANTLQELGCQPGGPGTAPDDTGTSPAATEAGPAGAAPTAPTAPGSTAPGSTAPGSTAPASPTAGSAAAATPAAAAPSARPHAPRPDRTTTAPVATSPGTTPADPTTADPTADRTPSRRAAAGTGG